MCVRERERERKRESERGKEREREKSRPVLCVNQNMNLFLHSVESLSVFEKESLSFRAILCNDAPFCHVTSCMNDTLLFPKGMCLLLHWY